MHSKIHSRMYDGMCHRNECVVESILATLQNVKVNMSLYMVTILAGMLFTHSYSHTCLHMLYYYCVLACVPKCWPNWQGHTHMCLVCTFLHYYKLCNYACQVTALKACILPTLWYCSSSVLFIPPPPPPPPPPPEPRHSLPFSLSFQRDTFSHSLGHRGTNWVPLTSILEAFLSAALMKISSRCAISEFFVYRLQCYQKHTFRERKVEPHSICGADPTFCSPFFFFLSSCSLMPWDVGWYAYI